MATWLPIIVIGIYLSVVLYIGIFAFRRKTTGEDFFLASRSVGSVVFFLALFATNMTSVAILGSSGLAYKTGIGVFGMMATISALVIPVCLFFIGTRLWKLGKRFGHMTQVSFFRDRWECSTIGTVIFAVLAFMLLPYLIVSIVGGGTILETLSHGIIPYWLGGAIVALVVMGNVFFGGLRGAVWVNVFQTLLFLSFGVVAFAVIGGNLPGGFTATINHMVKTPALAPLMTRERIPEMVFLSFCFIPLSSIMFPHMAIMCFTAKRVSAFKKTVILYPICILAIWLPCVFLGAIGPSQPKVGGMMAATSDVMKKWLDGADKGTGETPKLVKLLSKSELPGAQDLIAAASSGTMRPEDFARRLADVKVEADKAAAAERAAEAKAAKAATAVAAGPPVERVAAAGDPPAKPPAMGPNQMLVAEMGRLAATNADSVLLQMLDYNAPAWLAGLLAAGIISAVMGSDCHQILALSTMFSKDVFEYYGGHKWGGEKATVFFGRAFIVAANTIAFIIALGRPPIFDIAVHYAFSGFAALVPVMIAALYWRRSTKYAALASTLWVAFCLTGEYILEGHFKAGETIWAFGGHKVLSLNKLGSLTVGEFLPVVPMVLGSVVLVVVVSYLTRPPSQQTVDRYFEDADVELPAPAVRAVQA